jgi:hypothetical protein
MAIDGTFLAKVVDFCQVHGMHPRSEHGENARATGADANQSSAPTNSVVERHFITERAPHRSRGRLAGKRNTHVVPFIHTDWLQPAVRRAAQAAPLRRRPAALLLDQRLRHVHAAQLGWIERHLPGLRQDAPALVGAAATRGATPLTSATARSSRAATGSASAA